MPGDQTWSDFCKDVQVNPIDDSQRAALIKQLGNTLADGYNKTIKLPKGTAAVAASEVLQTELIDKKFLENQEFLQLTRYDPDTAAKQINDLPPVVKDRLLVALDDLTNGQFSQIFGGL